MAVVKTKSTLIHDSFDTLASRPDPQLARGQLVMSVGSVANLATDSNLSTYLLADIPSNAVLQPETFFEVSGWGFAQVVIGIEGDTDALVDQAKSAENLVAPIAAGDGDHAKPLWEVLGMPADPGGMIRLIASAEANATGAGDMPFRIAYLIA